MTLTKNHKVFLGLLLLTVSSGAYLLYAVKKTPPPVSPPPGIASGNSETKNITYQEIKLAKGVSFPETDSKLPVYSQTGAPLSLFSQAQKLGQRFELKPLPNTGNIWLSDDKIKSLTLDRINQILTYQVDGLQIPESYSGPNRPTLGSAVKSAEDFTNSFDNWKEFKSDSQNLIFLKKAGSELEEASSQDADIVGVPFSQSVNGIPVRISDQVRPPVTIFIGQKNQIVKITARPQTVDLSSPEDYPVLAEKEALELLQQGHGKIISVSGQPLVESSAILKEITQISIQKIVLEYRLDTTANLLAPYYNFQGSFITGSSSAPNTVILLLPAVKL